MSDETKLLPCPFCGGKAEFERVGTGRQSCIVSCTDCGARLETGETFASGASWNSRTTPPTPDPREDCPWKCATGDPRCLCAAPAPSEAVAWEVVPWGDSRQTFVTRDAHRVAVLQQDMAKVGRDGWVITPLYTHPAPARGVPVTDEMVREWMDRHGLMMSLTDARAAVEDARTIERAALTPDAEGGA